MVYLDAVRFCIYKTVCAMNISTGISGTQSRGLTGITIPFHMNKEKPLDFSPNVHFSVGGSLTYDT